MTFTVFRMPAFISVPNAHLDRMDTPRPDLIPSFTEVDVPRHAMTFRESVPLRPEALRYTSMILKVADPDSLKIKGSSESSLSVIDLLLDHL